VNEAGAKGNVNGAKLHGKFGSPLGRFKVTQGRRAADDLGVRRMGGDFLERNYIANLGRRAGGSARQ